MKTKTILSVLCLLTAGNMVARRVDYSPMNTENEADLRIQQMTADKDKVYMPAFKRSAKKINWLTNGVIDISPDGKELAFLAQNGDSTNICVKNIEHGFQSPTLQRTNRTQVLDFTYTPDGQHLLFTDVKGEDCQICRTDAHEGYACETLTVKQVDYSPICCTDTTEILFARQQKDAFNVYRYNTKNNNMTIHAEGFNPCPIPGEETYVCCRINRQGKSEIWKIDMTTGKETCLVTAPKQSFSSPKVSPNGKWIVFVGEVQKEYGKKSVPNTDIFVCRTNGKTMVQLTDHVANDLSPVWSPDGEYIYFVSQRGNREGIANVWRMNIKE